MSEPENLTLVLLRELRADQDAMRREFRADGEAVRRELRMEQEVQRREMRDMARSIQVLSDVLRRQTAAIAEQTRQGQVAMADLRQDLELTIRTELGGAFANMETRVEDRVMRKIEELERHIEGTTGV